MNVRIGIIQSAKELDLELPDDVDSEKVIDEVMNAVSTASGMVWLTDRKGRRVGVATSKLAYIELAPDTEGRRVGFSAV